MTACAEASGHAEMGEITSEEMAALDENCEFFGLSRLQLMENAGAAVAREVRAVVNGGRGRGGGDKSKIIVFAGRGNNGGDGFVAARHLARDFDIRVFLLGQASEIRTEEARKNWEVLRWSGCALRELRDSSELRLLKDEVSGAAAIVDAIFGTGIRGEIREPEATAIDLMNVARGGGVPIIAVDVPSGLDPDTGSVAGKCVRASVTVTFHKPKPGLRQRAEVAATFVGELKVASIGIPPEIERLAGPGDLKLLRRRRANSHKGDNGRVLIVGGGPFSGAPTLAAFAALHAGADWVTVAAPKSVSKTIASFSPNLIVEKLSSDIFVEDDVPAVLELAMRHDVTVVGMGLGDDGATKNALRTLFSLLEGKIVVDADGFYGLELPAKASQKVIITPHAGEFSKIPSVAEKPPADIEERAEFVRRFSRKNGVVTLMKGVVDVISDGERVKLNTTGNAGMTVGGTGDVLAGVVGAFYAVSEAFRAAVAAAFVNGAAGDSAFDKHGYGLLATDVIENIPKVLLKFGRR